MRIGIIVATEPEKRPFYEVFGEPENRHFGSNGFEAEIWNNNYYDNIFLVRSGIGEIAAAIATQRLIDKLCVNRVINYGVVGSLSEEHLDEEVGIVKSVVHYDFDASFGTEYIPGQYPGEEDLFIRPKRNAISDSATVGIPRFICASADKVVPGGEPKRKLRRDLGADICEMEAAGIIIACNRNNIPCTLIKAVSDGVDEDTEAFDQHVYVASKKCVELIADLIEKRSF